MNYDLKLAEKLTILLPLKGRPLFTLRYLIYMEAVKCPFHILIADGSCDDQNKDIIEDNKHRFPSLSFQYIRFPEDKTIVDFEKKMADSLAMIQTPYVMWNSNDDFSIIETMLECIKFLEQDTKKEYVACGGQYLAFSTKNDGAFEKIVSLKIAHEATNEISFEHDVAFERVIQQMPYRASHLQYAVLRIEVFFNIFNDLYCNNITDLMCSEYYTVRSILVAGKTYQLDSMALYLWGSRYKSISHVEKNLIELLICGNYYRDNEQTMHLLADHIIKKGNFSENSVITLKNLLKETWVRKLKPTSFAEFLLKLNVQRTNLWPIFHRINFILNCIFRNSFFFFFKKHYLITKLYISNRHCSKLLSKTLSIINNIQKIMS